ncbi:MAG TPA: LamG-like jellyroll fold domain-containing protein [Sedimentisphaerales bacterium]|nr:LamG-like jellyroll fold domain-containing protein [Sedimentisphaerales bacterium]
MCKKLIYLLSFVLVLGLASSASAELVAYWTFNHDPNDSIGDLNWTLENGADYSYWIDRKEGSHTLSLDGIDDYGWQDAVGPLIDAFTEKSVALWFKAASTSGVQTLYDEGGATNGLAIDVNDGALMVAVRDDSVQYTLSTPFDSIEWTHAAVTYDNGLLVLYVNGAEAGSVMADFVDNEVSSHSNGAGLGATEQNAFGVSTTPTQFFAGLIDYVVLYDHVLSADEVADLAAPPKPWSPIPVDGAVHTATSVDLSWTPGINAASHNVYLGDNVDNVTAGTEDTLKGSPAISQLTVGDLAPDTTYYWRVDDVEEDGTTVHTGDVWSLWIPPQTAYDPSPADGAKFVGPAVTFSWTPGLDATTHTVYLSDNFDDVNNAADGVPQAETTYTPDLLAKGTVYYWRVDEFDGTDTHKGDVWSLETPPDIAITDANLVGWWKLDGEYFDLGYVIDYSGYDHHGTLRGDPQLVEGYDGGALDFDGDGDYVNIDGYKGVLSTDGVQHPLTITAWVNTTDSGDRTIASWGTSTNGIRVDFRLFSGRLRVEHGAGNMQGDTNLNDGEWHHAALTMMEGATISYPDVKLWLDGKDDTREGTDPDAFAITAGDDMSIGRRAHNNSRLFIGSLDDVRLYDKELTELDMKVISGLLESTSPEPADGAKVVDNFAILGWTPGPFGVEFDVYFGVNPKPDAEELVGRVSEPTHFATGLVEGKTYYWRVDDVEADGTTIHTGDVWSFWIPPRGAYNPEPADGQAVTDTETDLSWSADWNPVMYGVYFGTDADQVASAAGAPPTMEVGFDPGPLEPGTTYYWRADVFYGTWVTGPVWSFSVSAPE